MTVEAERVRELLQSLTLREILEVPEALKTELLSRQIALTEQVECSRTRLHTAVTLADRVEALVKKEFP